MKKEELLKLCDAWILLYLNNAIEKNGSYDDLLKARAIANFADSANVIKNEDFYPILNTLICTSLHRNHMEDL